MPPVPDQKPGRRSPPQSCDENSRERKGCGQPGEHLKLYLSQDEGDAETEDARQQKPLGGGRQTVAMEFAQHHIGVGEHGQMGKTGRSDGRVETELVQAQHGSHHEAAGRRTSRGRPSLR